jgi:hypothetical protein
MYFLNIDALAQKLKDGSLTQSQRMKYLLVTVIVYAIVTEISFLFAEPVTNLQIIQSVLIVGSTVGGTYYCYLVNRNGDNRDFIDRFICIGWVASVRVIILFFIAYFIYILAGYAFAGEAFEQFLETTSYTDVSFTLAMCLYCYWLIAKHIKRIAYE